jgi:formate dehydrogenase accessory protein FdhD
VRTSIGTSIHPALAVDDGRAETVDDAVADEVPVALAYNGISHAVMLATPADLEDFATGFSLSEDIVGRIGEIHDVEIEEGPQGITVDLSIPAGRFAALKERRRNLAGRTGCGLCGTESLDTLFRPLSPVDSTFTVGAHALAAAFVQLARQQPLFAVTGAIHAAGWGRNDGTLTLVREDVGRHNALDKLIGAMARDGIAFDDGFALLTSRASSEMIQKAAVMRMPMIAAISAPTSLAIKLAQQSGVTLAAFVRGRRYKLYAHPERIRQRIEETAS